MNMRLMLANFIAAVLIVGVMGAVVLHLQGNQRLGKAPESRISPLGRAEVVIPRGRGGHYSFRGQINGQDVRFLLDTGATYVSIPEQIADDLGLVREEGVWMNTANGRSRSYITTLNQVSVGDINMTEIKGAISTGMQGHEILLGMSFLRELEISQKEGVMTLIQ